MKCVLVCGVLWLNKVQQEIRTVLTKGYQIGVVLDWGGVRSFKRGQTYLYDKVVYNESTLT